MTKATQKHLQEMAQFHSRSLAFLSQILCPLLLLIFTIIIHPSNGEPLGGIDLVQGICSSTSDRSFCLNALIPDELQTAVEIATKALSSAQRTADNARNLIARLLAQSTYPPGGPHAYELLQMCQLHIDKAIADLRSANTNLNSHSHNIGAMAEDLNNAAAAAKTCQDIIQGNKGIPNSSELATENDTLIKFCEISLASTEFFPPDFNLP